MSCSILRLEHLINSEYGEAEELNQQRVDVQKRGEFVITGIDIASWYRISNMSTSKPQASWMTLMWAFEGHLSWISLMWAFWGPSCWLYLASLRQAEWLWFELCQGHLSWISLMWAFWGPSCWLYLASLRQAEWLWFELCQGHLSWISLMWAFWGPSYWLYLASLRQAEWLCGLCRGHLSDYLESLRQAEWLGGLFEGRLSDHTLKASGKLNDSDLSFVRAILLTIWKASGKLNDFDVGLLRAILLIILGKSQASWMTSIWALSGPSFWECFESQETLENLINSEYGDAEKSNQQRVWRS